MKKDNKKIKENITMPKDKENKNKSEKEILEKNTENSDLIDNKGQDEDKYIKLNSQLEEQLSELREERLRLLAEMENIRKRSEKEKVESIKFGSANLARDILSLNDNLSRALENFPDEDKAKEPIKNLVEGIVLIQKEFNSILIKHGIEKNNALNQKFDHNLHQAMLEIETDEHKEGIVVQEIQSGYTMHDRLLRPTLVGVSKKPNVDKKK